MEKCGVMTCSDQAMLPAACYALLSFAKNTVTENTRYILIGVGLSAKDIDNVARFGQRHDIEIAVVEYNSIEPVMQTQGRWSQVTLARLYADLLISDDFDRLLYVDADVIAAAPIDALWHMKLGNNLVAAVNDYIMAFPKKAERRMRRLGLAHGPAYFNAGVLLFSWKRCIEEGLFAECRRLLAENPGGFEANDQDVLNIVCQGRWLPLDHSWNVQTGIASVVAKPVIVHFTGRRKPWQKSIYWQHRPFVIGYKKAFEATPWSGFCEKRGAYRDVIDFSLYVGSRLGALPRASAVKSYFGRHRVGEARARTT